MRIFVEVLDGEVKTQYLLFTSPRTSMNASDLLLVAASLLAADSGLLGADDSATCRDAAAAYENLAGMGDSAEMLRSRGADPEGLLSDEALLDALASLAAEIAETWA